MYGSGGLGPLLGGRDSGLLRAGDDHGARKLLAEEQPAGWTAAGAERAELPHHPPTGSYVVTVTHSSFCFFMIFKSTFIRMKHLFTLRPPSG